MPAVTPHATTIRRRIQPLLQTGANRFPGSRTFRGRSDLDRATSLRRKNIISEDQIEHARRTWEEATALLLEAEAHVRVARKRLD
jgi:multidrug resistance efflux pump